MNKPEYTCLKRIFTKIYNYDKYLSKIVYILIKNNLNLSLGTVLNRYKNVIGKDLLSFFNRL